MYPFAGLAISDRHNSGSKNTNPVIYREVGEVERLMSIQKTRTAVERPLIHRFEGQFIPDLLVFQLRVIRLLPHDKPLTLGIHRFYQAFRLSHFIFLGLERL